MCNSKRKCSVKMVNKNEGTLKESPRVNMVNDNDLTTIFIRKFIDLEIFLYPIFSKILNEVEDNIINTLSVSLFTIFELKIKIITQNKKTSF